ncbi:MAG: GatB/YqeY domain-containing protein [Rhodobacteraceae bacterium]|nr:GatB/YqeY domain-containing protein [Paracoccaceae bacterium]
MIRKRLMDAQKEAMKAREVKRLSTLRLVNAAIKDKDIAARTEESADGVSDAGIMGILAKMIKQRQDSSKIFEEAGRIELAEGERAEIKVIEEFLPKQLSGSEVEAVIAAAIAEVDAKSIRDMGKIMGVLKGKYTGQMDFGKAGAAVKAALA